MKSRVLMLMLIMFLVVGMVGVKAQNLSPTPTCVPAPECFSASPPCRMPWFDYYCPLSTVTPAPTCKWCGDKCISASLEVMCTMQAPPVGASCEYNATVQNPGCEITVSDKKPNITPGVTFGADLPKTGQCKWCGDKCISASLEVMCTMQAPPVGASCGDIGTTGVGGCGITYVGTTNPVTSQCKWCGNRCVPESWGEMCTMQAPPVGASCRTLGSSGTLGCGIFYDGGSLPSLPTGCQYVRPDICPRDQTDGCEYQLDCSQKNEVCPSDKPSRRQGNTDCDGVVGLMDYAAWYAEYQTYLSDQIIRSDWTADFDFNGKVDVQDFSIWYASYILWLNDSLGPIPTQVTACNTTPPAGCQLMQAGCLSDSCCPVVVCITPSP